MSDSKHTDQVRVVRTPDGKTWMQGNPQARIEFAERDAALLEAGGELVATLDRARDVWVTEAACVAHLVGEPVHMRMLSLLDPDGED
jgi:hypothetical protein